MLERQGCTVVYGVEWMEGFTVVYNVQQRASQRFKMLKRENEGKAAQWFQRFNNKTIQWLMVDVRIRTGFKDLKES